MNAGVIRTVIGDTRPLHQDELGEFLSLAAEIQAAEGLDVDAALDRAAEQLDELGHYYPYLWDSTAFTAGNWDAMAGAIPF
jgi:hypothetical protein